MNNLRLILKTLGTKPNEYIGEVEISLDDVVSIDITNGVQIFSVNERDRNIHAEGIQIRSNRVLRIIPSAANSIFLSTE